MRNASNRIPRNSRDPFVAAADVFPLQGLASFTPFAAAATFSQRGTSESLPGYNRENTGGAQSARSAFPPCRA